MIDKQVFKPIKYDDLNDESKESIIPSLIFLKQKYNADGTKNKVKARLVASGNYQNQQLYPDHGSPTVNLEHLLLELTIAACKDSIVVTLDTGSAYLNADMSKENILMNINPDLAQIL